MRLLLVAYEFPPSPSPQSLRWAYLVRELDALGHEIHVLAPDFGGDLPGLPMLPAGITVHRCFAGPFRGLLAIGRRRRFRRQAAETREVAEKPRAMPTALRPPRNWKQRVSEAMQWALGCAIYPDVRGEWKPWARPALRRLLERLQPDHVVVDGDLKKAVAYYDHSLGEDADEGVNEALEELRPRLQGAIAKQTSIKATPIVSFEPDKVVRSAARIEDVLRASSRWAATTPDGA